MSLFNNKIRLSVIKTLYNIDVKNEILYMTNILQVYCVLIRFEIKILFTVQENKKFRLQ